MICSFSFLFVSSQLVGVLGAALEGMILLTQLGLNVTVPYSMRTRNFFILNKTPFPMKIEYAQLEPELKPNLWMTGSWNQEKVTEKTIGARKKDLFFSITKGGGIKRGATYTFDFNCTLQSDPKYNFSLQLQTTGSLIGSIFNLTYASPKGQRTMLLSNKQRHKRIPIFKFDNDTTLFLSAWLESSQYGNQLYLAYVVHLEILRKQLKQEYEEIKL